jgi:hypothetical protein
MNTPKHLIFDLVMDGDPKAFQRFHGRKMIRSIWVAIDSDLPEQPRRKARVMSRTERYFASLNREQRKKILAAMHRVRPDEPDLQTLLSHLENDHDDLKLEEGDKP